MSFKEVTIKEISKYTSFTRPSIYNYFSTREDIFLALLQREYEAWIRYLEAVKPTSAEKTASGFAGMLAESLSTRPILLKLLAMNQFDMEEHSDVRCLAEFKSVCMAARKAVCSCLARYIPYMGIAEAEAFAYAFFPFMFGIYPYTFTVTDEVGLTSVVKGYVPIDVLVIRDGDKLKIAVPSIIFRKNAA
ncbi:MAG: TetR family transcriptional regulator, partial [Anaeroglobus sp.]